MIPDGNMDGHKEKESIRNGKCVDKLEKVFSSFLNLFKRELTTQSRNSNNVLWQS